ncbi:MAG: zinc ribbon domain-containing protein [Gammaproteobacteria bacterium]|nr:zinc ribbon domain-containing protein [Gammaproteobacteria bacterium]NNL99996.1 zinc ribbon domain-containing protein [Gammaproteobacteria bacterium]
MPTYAYFCPANGRTVEVRHGIDHRIGSWGELCYCAQIDLGDTDVMAPVEKRIFAPAIAVPPGNSDLKAKGFTKLVRREDGNYENVTALDGEAKIMKPGDKSTMPDIKKRIRD